MNKIFFKNVSFNFVFIILSTLSTFLLLRTIFNYFNFNQSDYGLWLIIFSILSYIYLMDFGISNGLRNIITPLVNSNKQLLNMYISSNFIIMILFTIILFIFLNGLIIIFPYELMYNVKGFHMEVNRFKLFLSVVVNLQIIYFFVSSIKPVFHAISKSYLVNMSQFISNMLITIILILSIHLNINNNWILLGFIYIGVQIIVIMCISVIVTKKYNIKFIINKNIKLYREILEFGYKFFFLQLSNLILFNSINILVGVFVSLEEASKFQISYKVLSIYIMLFNVLSAPIWTLIIIKWKDKNIESIKSIVKKLEILMLFVSIPLIITSVLLNFIVKLWMGKDFEIEISFSLMIAIYIIFSIICVVLQGVLNGLNLINIQIICYLVGTFILVFGVLILNKIQVINIVNLMILGNISLIPPISTMIIALKKFLRKEAINEK